MKAVRQLKSSGCSDSSSAKTADSLRPAPKVKEASLPPPPAVEAPVKTSSEQSDSIASKNVAIIDSPQVSGIISAVPGAQVVDIRKEVYRR
jgi:hypothetical protein